MSGLEVLLGAPAAATTAAPIAAGTTAAATPAALAGSLSAVPATPGLLGTAGITAGAGAAPTIGSIGATAGLGLEGISAGQTLGIFGGPSPAGGGGVPQLQSPQFPSPAGALLPLGVGPQLFGQASQAAGRISDERQSFIDQFLRGF